MKIIDAQVHIWLSGTPSGHHRQVSKFTAEEMLKEMDQAGVDAALIHPPVSWDPTPTPRRSTPHAVTPLVSP